MTTEYLFVLVAVIIEIIFGFISKKNPKISNKLIPIQNLFIGLAVAAIEFVVTKDFKMAIAVSGIFAGGAYDIVHNLRKFKEEE